ncbi:ISL3 family transposase [Actinomadura macra]|uniref:ISL3 family transposase n=1 Tax=Actinomadura macra TaxID=46164 RepID=UPI000B032AC0|nr:ISL3 family transposase [Actinomadura macra]
MQKISDLVELVFSGLSPLVIEDVVDQGELIWVRARTPDSPAACPGCGTASSRVHGYQRRTVADVPIDARRVVVGVRIRRLVCPTGACVQTFREQMPGVLERYQRRTPPPDLADRRGHAGIGGPRRHTSVIRAGCAGVPAHALRILLRLPLPERPVPRVLGVDDFALRKRRSYATVLIDAQTRQRVEVLPDRKADTLQAWLRAHPGVQVVCRDGSGAYAEAVRRALPGAQRVGDRWHIWHNLAEAVLKEVAAHSACWAKAGPPRRQGKRAATTRERWQQVHNLLNKGVGLLECSRRLGLALNTVKRYARVPEPERLVRAPAVPAHAGRSLPQPPAPTPRARSGGPGAATAGRDQTARLHRQQNLLYRYITQGRVEADRPTVSPRRFIRDLLTAPDQLKTTGPSGSTRASPPARR